jgi:hypothetical protein
MKANHSFSPRDKRISRGRSDPFDVTEDSDRSHETRFWATHLQVAGRLWAIASQNESLIILSISQQQRQFKTVGASNI